MGVRSYKNYIPMMDCKGLSVLSKVTLEGNVSKVHAAGKKDGEG